MVQKGRFLLQSSASVQGGPNPGHVAEEKPATAAVNSLGSKSPNFYIIQVLSTFLAFRNIGARSRYPAAASGLDLDRPLHRSNTYDPELPQRQNGKASRCALPSWPIIENFDAK